MALPVSLEDLSRFEDLEDASRLYRETFGYSGPESGLNPRLLRSLTLHGGTAIGARDQAGTLIGFAYGFTGLSGESAYHYSQAVVVAGHAQGQGLGRLLKQEQRARVLANGVTRMRWSFNPLYARNAHLNLDVLGASGRWYVPEYFGPRDGGRMIVEWDLTAGPPPQEGSVPGPVADAVVAAFTAGTPWGGIIEVPGGRGIPIPAGVAAGDTSPSDDLGGVAERLGASLTELLAQGYTAVSCRRTGDEGALYLLTQEEPG